MRILPSIAVGAIKSIFPWSKERHAPAALKSDQAPSVGAVLALVEAIPEELLPRDPETRARLLSAVGRTRGAMQTWSGGGHPEYLAKLGEAQDLGGRHPIAYIVTVLESCDEQGAPASTAGLTFIQGAEEREALRIDVAEAQRALGHSDYKAATVLAGSVIEALLLWAIDQHKEGKIADVLGKWRSEPKSLRVPI